jgi:polysaccharide biosynthesis protein PelF
MLTFPLLRRRPATPVYEADVCLIAEGCYPYVAGGVSSWIDWLIRSHPEITFSVLAILPGAPDGEPRYKAPDNLVATHHLRLDQNTGGRRRVPTTAPEDMARLVSAMLDDGGAEPFEALIEALGPAGKRPDVNALLNSQHALETICQCYQTMPHASFIGYFWAFRTLMGGLYRILNYPLPSARVYHAVSTGYAGLIGARAAIETGRASVITEHGIYSNERRIEILMADWIANSVDTGLDLSDDREDIREFWARAFESFARTGYATASEIVALYGDNQIFQRALGADPEKLRVIPNGVDTTRFSELLPRKGTRPTMAFIGRVTPIKDVQTFIDVAEAVAQEIPYLNALIIGPMDEDPEYAQGCIDEVERRGLSGVVTFTGPVNVRDYLSEIDVMILTSISEALPLVILEAGAAGVPCIATDVGACREIIEGKKGRKADRTPGGMVVPVGASEDIAHAVLSLLLNDDLRKTYGANLKARINSQYRAEAIAEAYGAFYQRHLKAADKTES